MTVRGLAGEGRCVVASQSRAVEMSTERLVYEGASLLGKICGVCTLISCCVSEMCAVVWYFIEANACVILNCDCE